jgi:hypothetical protein
MGDMKKVKITEESSVDDREGNISVWMKGEQCG